MPRPAVTRLREDRTPGPIEAPVIDAAFTVVGRRTWLGRLWRGVLALAAAAVVGFLVPPVWVLVQNLREMLER